MFCFFLSIAKCWQMFIAVGVKVYNTWPVSHLSHGVTGVTGAPSKTKNRLTVEERDRFIKHHSYTWHENPLGWAHSSVGESFSYSMCEAYGSSPTPRTHTHTQDKPVLRAVKSGQPCRNESDFIIMFWRWTQHDLSVIQVSWPLWRYRIGPLSHGDLWEKRETRVWVL